MSASCETSDQALRLERHAIEKKANGLAAQGGKSASQIARKSS